MKLKLAKIFSCSFLLLFLMGCVKTNQGYNCETGNCKAATGDAQYLTLADCKSDCSENTPQTPATPGGTGSGGTTPGTTPPTTTPVPKGQVLVWTNQVEYGWKPAGYKGTGGGYNVMNVTILSLSGTISGGHYTSEPSCGATYGFTASLAPGKYTVYGKIYFLKDLYGNSYSPYSTSQTFTVYSNQCTKVLLK